MSLHEGKIVCVDGYNVILEDKLGSGSYGEAWKVKEMETGQECALKALKKDKDESSRRSENLKNECIMQRKLRGIPFVINSLRSSEDDEYLYILMEYAEGGDLREVIGKGKLSIDDIRSFIAQIVLGVENIHERNIIHRDIKPENTLLTANGHVRLTDFGTSKKISEASGTYCGTVDYMAPEMSEPVGWWQKLMRKLKFWRKPHAGLDWYSVGVMLYEMLFEDYPGIYDSESDSWDRTDILYPEDADPIVVNLLRGLLEEDPDRRFGAREVKNHRWFSGIDWEHLAITHGRVRMLKFQNKCKLLVFVT
jgi:serine/threonine protein kinase